MKDNKKIKDFIKFKMNILKEKNKRNLNVKVVVEKYLIV